MKVNLKLNTKMNIKLNIEQNVRYDDTDIVNCSLIVKQSNRHLYGRKLLETYKN